MGDVVMKLWAKNNRLYLGNRRIGQVIINTFKQNDIGLFKSIDDVIDYSDNPLYDVDYNEVSRGLVITKKKFFELLSKGDSESLLNLPLYSKAYYPEWLIDDDNDYVDFDFIQVEGKLLIFADGDNVRVIGDFDDEASYYLLYYGLILNDEQVVKGINYAVDNNLNLRSVGHDSFMMLSNIAKLMRAGIISKIKSVRKDSGMFIITTSEGVFYVKDNFVTNDKDLLTDTVFPVKGGAVIRVDGTDYLAFDFNELKGEPVVFFEVNESSVPDSILDFIKPNLVHPDNLPVFIKYRGKKIYLNAHYSPLMNEVVAGNRRFKVRLAKGARIGGKPALVNVNGRLLIKVPIVLSFTGSTIDYYDIVDSFVRFNKLGHSNIVLDKLSSRVDVEKYKRIINSISRVGIISLLNKVNDGLYYKVVDLSLNEGVIYLMGVGELSLKGVMFGENGSRKLIIKDERGEYRSYKLVRVDNVFKRLYIGDNYKIKVTANKLSLNLISIIAQLQMIVNTVPLNFDIEVSDSVIKIVVGNKVYRFDTGSVRFDYIKNTFIIYRGKRPSSFVLPVEHEIVKSFVSLLVVDFTKGYGYWHLGNEFNEVKNSYVNYRFFNGKKLDSPLFLNGEFEIAGVKVRPSHYKELNGYKVLLSDLKGETIKVPIIKNRSLLSYF